MIELKHVNKSFKGEQVLKDVNLNLYNNEIYGFVGRNGSGKTVLFKLIAGYMYPDTGEIIINGKKIGVSVDFPENMGALIEHPGFLWFETGYQNLAYLAAINKRISKEEVRQAMEKVGLNPDSKKKVGKYSLGMKQRLGIAQAIMEHPYVLILDEPMNGLDDKGIEDIRKLILSLRAENRVIIISSHNKEDIRILCDKVFMIYNGKVNIVEEEG